MEESAKEKREMLELGKIFKAQFSERVPIISINFSL